MPHHAGGRWKLFLYIKITQIAIILQARIPQIAITMQARINKITIMMQARITKITITMLTEGCIDRLLSSTGIEPHH